MAQGPTLSLSMPATMLQAVAKQISVKTGTAIAVDRSLGEVPVIVAVKDVSQEELLQKLAHCVGAEVALVDGSYRIRRSAKVEAELREKERSALEQRWIGLLAEKRKVLEKNPWTATHAQKVIDLGRKRSRDRSIVMPVQLKEFDPSARLLFRLLEAIGPQALGQIPPVGRTVYSRFPTPMQRALPKSVESLLVQFAKDIQASPPGLQDRQGISGTVGKLHLCIDNTMMEPGADLMLYNQDGSAGEDADIGDFQALPDGKVSENRFGSLKPFQASALTQALSKYATAIYGTDDPFEPVVSGPQEPSVELRTIFLNPEASDPLSFLYSEALFEYAKQRGVNLVACPPDYDGDEMDFLDDQGQVDLQKVATLFASEMEWSEAKGWAVIRPEFILDVDEHRVSRSALGSFFKKVYKNGSSLITEVDYAAGLPRRRLGYSAGSETLFLGFHYLSQLQGGPPFSAYGSRYLSRFLGLLTPIQRQRLGTNGVLSATELLPRQVAALADAAYDEGYIEYDESVSETIPEFLTEPTEALPNGVPPGTQVFLKSEAVQVLLVRFGTSTAKVSAQQIAAARLVKGKVADGTMQKAKDVLEKMNFEQVYRGTIDTHNLLIQYGKGVERSETFTYRNIRQAKPVAADSIPDLKAEIALHEKDFAGKSVSELVEIAFGSWED